ncbi:MAG: hypothetical protein QNL62_14900 [Gammaproteobacteria bacterium]|nr:hypothetical protein [Gammaproteobacteria bacterium]
MYRTCRNLVLLYAVFFSLFISKQTLAEETVSSGNVLKKVVKSNSINQGGFIFDIQKVDPALLAADVEKLRGAYIRRQHELAQRVESKKLNTGDAIITVLIPGGLLYAGYRKQELEKAKSVLLAVTTEIKELSNDLIALQGQDTTHPLILAKLP